MISENLYTVQHTRSGYILKHRYNGKVHPERFATKEAAARRAKSLHESEVAVNNMSGGAIAGEDAVNTIKKKKIPPRLGLKAFLARRKL